ncbi:E3 ubiquitin-protein ligase rnf168 [Periophthalmus magnuspinnatus]|uniref:E3 ubiquitin-protein ligase rnf168 n=1 Tax=Periophthalmus magnuspinnatus TaxID=409849 RepID=UPI00243673AA|nr:E3 ubiquitin-protein ligase rnf168 [Periophthalmus magnuspinnatus]
MAPVSDVKQGAEGGRRLSREDCLCPICLEIFMEPVTLLCTHTFCKVCFLESVDKSTLCCPLCRKRVSTWVREHSRNNSLVNEALWERIQREFPQSAERRREEEHTEPTCFPRLSEPGALRQEYEDQLSKLTEEKRAVEEQERRASEELIQRLLEEEEELVKEQRRRAEEDERLARLLSQQLNEAAESERSRVPEQTPVKKKPVGQMDRFLCPLSRSHSSQANKENILARLSSSLEPPQLDFYGPETERDQSHLQESVQEETDRSTDQSDHGDMPVEGGNKRKSDEVRSEEEEETRGKRSCQSSCLVGVSMVEWEAELQRRRRQEEDDLRLALELQRQLDRQRETDRRKGSEDAYPLRTPRRTRESTAATPVRRRPPPSATVTLSTLSAPQMTPSDPKSAVPTSPSAPAPPKQTCAFKSLLSTPKPGPGTPKTCQKSPKTCQKANRQTTLTDLFNLHSSR